MKMFICLLMLLALPAAAVEEGDAQIVLSNEDAATSRAVTTTTEPASRDTTEVIIGTPYTGNYIPFWGSSWNACRTQILFLQSEINYAGDIVTFSWRPSTSVTGSFDNFRVYMCHTSATQLSTVFADNYTGNTPVEVMNVPTMVAGGPADQWWDWSVNFPYNNVDNLLVEVRWNGDNGIGVPMYRTTEAVDRRAYVGDDTASVGSTSLTGQFVRLYMTPSGGGGGPYVWDFETGWQDWTHTGAYSFPNGWAVKAANYNGASYIIPSSGDSSFWFDDDEAGSSAPPLQDTALSPVVPGFDCNLLKWGVTFNILSTSEIYQVGLKYHNGSSWQVVALRNYTVDVAPTWDSVDVSAYAGYDSLQVYFYYNDAGGWQWYGAFDNVGLYPALTHDVGSVAFLSPGPMIAPGAEDVVGVVANYGGESETYDVHCLVSDNTFAVVLDTTINVTTGAGEQDTLNFGSLTFVEGRTYDLTMATLLGTDVNPTNDTLEQTTFCTAVYWEVLTPMPNTRSGPFAGYAVISDTTYVHVFGGNPTASQTLHDVYNVTTGTWSTGTPLPMAMNYGGHCSIDNKIYLIGSFIAASNPYMVIYDAESNVYTNVTLPTAINDPGIAVVDNSLIYIIGGGSPMGWYPSTVVQLYDVAGDSFFTGVTQLPGPIMSGVGGYLGNDTIIHSSGLTTGSVYVNTTYLGYINPSNPASITWSTGTPKPGLGTYRFNGGSFIPPSGPGRLYVAAGQGTGGVYLAATYVYVSGTGWLTLPDKPAEHSNWGAAMVPLQDADGEYILYAAGGYTGSYLNIFHALHTGIDPTGIFEQPGEAPMAFGFSLLTSNPARSEVRFQFDMPYQGLVNFSVFDIVGRQILNSDYSNISAGTHTLVWNRTDNRGRAVANGVYFYRVQAAGNVATGKLILVQ